MANVGLSISAIAFAVVGGVMNSSWPLCCKPESPKFLRVASPDGWQWENVWLPFTVWGAVLNVILCVAVVGRSALSAVYRESSSFDIGLVCTFGFLWGSGTACFSLGIQLLGAGPGTALVMSLLVVIGTLLPLIEDHADNAGSPAAVVTMVGLLFAISGFLLSAQSSRIKARAIKAAQLSQSKYQASSGKQVQHDLASVDIEVSASAAKLEGESDRSDPDTTVSASTTAGSTGTSSGPEAAVVKAADSKEGKATRSTMHKAGSVGVLPSGQPQKRSGANGGEGKKTSHLAAVAVCILGAVMSSMLQFSFVYGDPLITYAEEEAEVPGAAAPLVVWLLAFSLASIGNVGYAMYLLQTNKTWSRYAWVGWADLLGKFRKVTVMSVFFVGHIHFYGLSQHLFGDLGPVVAWPLIMSSTVLSGQMWSIFMKEWVGVPRLAMQVNIASIVTLVTAVTIIAIAGAVL